MCVAAAAAVDPQSPHELGKRRTQDQHLIANSGHAFANGALPAGPKPEGPEQERRQQGPGLPKRAESDIGSRNLVDGGHRRGHSVRLPVRSCDLRQGGGGHSRAQRRRSLRSIAVLPIGAFGRLEGGSARTLSRPACRESMWTVRARLDGFCLRTTFRYRYEDRAQTFSGTNDCAANEADVVLFTVSAPSKPARPWEGPWPWCGTATSSARCGRSRTPTLRRAASPG